MTSRITFLLFFVVIVLSSVAQEDTSSNFKYITSFNTTQKATRSIGVNLSSTLGSNHVNSQMYFDYLFGTSFSTEAKSSFQETDVNRSKVQLQGNAKLSYSFGDSWLDRVEINRKGQLFSNLSGEGSKLILFGNKSYANETVDFDELDVMANSSYGLKVYKQFEIKNGLFLTAGLGGLLVDNLVSVQTDDFSVFTETQGSHIDVNAQGLRFLENGQGLSGFGLDASLNLSAYGANSNWSISIDDISPIALINGKEYTLDTNARFEGVLLDLNEITSGEQGSGFFSEYDSIWESKSEKKNVMLLPSVLRAMYSYKIKVNQNVGLAVETRSLGKYGTDAAIFHDIKVRDNVLIRSMIGYGDYSGFYLNESVEVAFGGFNGFASVQGLTSLISPRNLGYLGINFGLAKRL